MKNEILKKISSKVGQELSLEQKVADIDIDSLDLMTYIFEIEEEYQIELDQEQLQNMTSVDNLVSAILEKINSGVN